jgi:tyrosyl-tRNA synthetase
MPKSTLINRVEGFPILDLLSTDTTIFASKGEARKMILAGGLSINKRKATDPNHVITKEDLIFEEYLLVQKGKKNYFLVHFQ